MYCLVMLKYVVMLCHIHRGVSVVREIKEGECGKLVSVISGVYVYPRLHMFKVYTV